MTAPDKILILYADWVVVQEYAPPKTIDAHKARQRLFDIIAATISVLGIAPNKLVLKTRERQKGKNQYQKLGEKGEFLEVTEYNVARNGCMGSNINTGARLPGSDGLCRRGFICLCAGQPGGGFALFVD